MRVWTNWLQLARYAIVGVIGYAISVATFAVLYHVAGASPWLAATGAFCLALANNFLWNRHWTFRAGDGHAGFQAMRFFVVSVLAFLFSLGMLELLISGFGVPKVAAQAISIAAATPLNFLGNKMWSFGQGR